jgi:GTP-binding protein Era
MNKQEKPEHANDIVSSSSFKSGFVTFVGRPNSGKSTLINTIIGQKVAITANVPQTTRHRFRAILDSPDYQLVLVDTPGIHKPHDALGEELNASAIKALEAVDAVAFLLDASKAFGSGDAWILSHLEKQRCPKLLVLSKCDLVNQETVELQIRQATGAFQFDAVYCLSSVNGQGVPEFVDALVKLLPEGPRWFPEGTTTDQEVEVLVAEFIREKVLHQTSDEVPHAVGVQVEEMSFDARRDLYSIEATIYVERESQKGILIGKGGERIKSVGSDARIDLERLLNSHVYLDLRVKTRKKWRRDANQIRRFGYG